MLRSHWCVVESFLGLKLLDLNIWTIDRELGLLLSIAFCISKSKVEDM